jgi:hypothetical protein
LSLACTKKLDVDLLMVDRATSPLYDSHLAVLPILLLWDLLVELIRVNINA